MKKGINAWAKELKHNESFAKKYEGVKTVQDIINVAKTQGYDINKKDLQELDLDAVAGGFFGKPLLNVETALTVGTATQAAFATGDGAQAGISGTIDQNLKSDT